jgi:hypothetical protein
VLLAVTSPPITTTRPALDVPAALRDLDVPSGCAADYDGWLMGVPA